MIPDFLIPILVGFFIQVIKLILDYIDEKKFHIENLRRAGGFPSVHSALSSSIATLMFLVYGYESPEFAITLTFSILFWYDAMSVRYEAGKHAKYINQISFELKNILNFSDGQSLKERIGHTFIEVLGGIFIGFLLTICFFYLRLYYQ